MPKPKNQVEAIALELDSNVKAIGDPQNIIEAASLAGIDKQRNIS